MLPETAALLEESLYVIAIAIAGAIFGAFIERLWAGMRRNAWRRRHRTAWQQNGRGGKVIGGQWNAKPNVAASPQRDAADQLRIVMAASFSVQSLLNKSEARVFKELDRMVISRNPSWQVMAQVSLGEILRSNDATAYGCNNSKRVDLLIVDEDCQPRHALEYQGFGHHQTTAAARDAVKKEALRRAGIGYHEVVAGHTTPSDLRRLVEKLVDEPKVAH